VTDPISTSKSARESLSRGLTALQADPTVPAPLVELAAPIAQAMGALHQIERTQQLVPHAEVALNHVRGALSQLQAAQSSHPAVGQALEAVATSLSLVHSLGKMANGPQAAPPQAGAQPAPAPARVATAEMAQKPAAQAQPQQAPPQAWNPPAPQQGYGQQAGYPGPGGGPPGAPAQQVAPGSQPQMVARDPFAPPPAPGAGPGAGGGVHMPPVGQPQRASIPVPSPPPGNFPMVSADLGAHSPTNFFKGLAGNDIIDHGGLFVSTYVLPKIGSPIRLKVSLPGGYEFEANAVVKWTREDGGGDAPPGFGAQFTQITPEARQLVYRYVRNREPVFYDDL